MEFEDLVKNLETNAATVRPVKVTVPGIGTLYVRKRTVLEYEQMSDVRVAMANKDKEQEAAGQSTVEKSGILAAAVARLLCKEDGSRFTSDQEQQLAVLISQQPDNVFHAIINASDGKQEEELQTGK